MLTRPGWLLALGAAALGVGGRLLGLVELYVLAGAGAVALVGAVAVVRTRPPSLTAQRAVRPDRVPAGSAARVEMSIRAEGRRRSAVTTLIDPVGDRRSARLRVAPLSPGEVTSAGYRLPTRARGPIAIGPLRAEVTDPLGLARATVELASETRLLVLPRVETLGPRPSGAGSDLASPAQGQTRTRRGAEEFHALRPYVVGDDLRRVHWPMSARHDELVVRVDDEIRQGRTTVLLDLHGADGDDTFEAMVSAAASVVVAHARSGDRVRLLTTDGGDSGWIEGATGADTLLAGLALIQPADGPPGATGPAPVDLGGSAVITIAGPRSELPADGPRGVVVRCGAVGAGSPATTPPDRRMLIDVAPGASLAAAWAAAAGAAPRPRAGAR